MSLFLVLVRRCAGAARGKSGGVSGNSDDGDGGGGLSSTEAA